MSLFEHTLKYGFLSLGKLKNRYIFDWCYQYLFTYYNLNYYYQLLIPIKLPYKIVKLNRNHNIFSMTILLNVFNWNSIHSF